MINEMEKKFGSVEFKGKRYVLTQQAFVDNYGTDGDVVYKAHAMDEEENEYLVTWDTTEKWSDDCEECAEYTGGCCPYHEDESNACEWDNPVSVSKV